MAVGSNSLALLFKVGIDTGDAQKQVTSLGKVLSDLGTAFKQGLGEGATKAAKDFEQATTGALEKVGTALNQTRSGLENLFRGDVLEGTTQLARQFGVLAVGLGAVALAGLAVKKSIEGIIDVADKVGTDSRDDFEELQKSMARVGETITLIDHGLSQELLKSAEDVKTAFDAMFVEMLRIEGPALILLFNQVVKFIREQLIPAADSFAARQVEGIVQFIGLVRGLQAIHNLPTGIMGTDFREWAGIVQGYVAQTRRELESLQSELKGTTGGFAPGAIVKAGKAPVDEFQKALDAAQKDYDAFKKRLDDNLIKSMEDLSKELNQQVLDYQKYFANLKQQWLDYSQFVAKEMDQIVKDIARQAQPVPGGGTGIPGLPDPKDIQDQLDAIHETTKKGFIDDLGSTLEQSGLAFTSWGDLVGGVLSKVAGATEQLLENFILTGHGGAAAFKALAAAIIASLAVQAGVEAIMEVARGIKELALAAADAASLNPWGAALHTASAHAHFSSAAVFGIIAAGAAGVGIGIGASGGLGGGTAGAAAGGGGFGGTQAPTPVTINQGAGGSLGIPPNTLLLSSIDQHLSNITTAPPGDVVQRGAEQNPMVIGQANNEAARRDGTVSREFLQISGLRTA
jgi:hypothetical protein